ncbi:MAG: two-component system sensor histidine kinase CreC [Syntrophaceae bacterium]
MKLGARIFICYLIIFSICFYYSAQWMKDKIRIRYLEGVEDTLVDQANIMAATIGYEMENRQFKTENLYKIFSDVYQRQLTARIFELNKTLVDMNMYITDTNGTVIFDAQDKENIGADYMKWRDVRLTLAGRYGARSTKKDINDPKSSVLHVAAPIYVNGEITGVLTIVKPTTNINSFIASFKPEFSKIIMISMSAAVFLSLLASFWITLPIKRLTKYANDIGAGKNVPFPKLDRTEIGEMGTAFEKMQTTLEGKKYVEQYIQTLTHEIKSPVSAILGAAELLEEKMEPQQRARFLANISNEANRINDIVERMLALSALESMKMPPKVEKISLGSLLNTVIESKQPILTRKKIIVSTDVQPGIQLKGDGFLLHEAIANVVQNAIDFSSVGDTIEITGKVDDKQVMLIIDDNGPGIPDFAREKIFDKFYSLQRPDTGKKSTGLGLNFVKEVAALHHGEIIMENREEKGTRAKLILPL